MKEAFYFPHDVNAIQDPKMMTLLSECGLMGIGAYWVLIEILHQQEWGAIGYPQACQYLAFYGKQGSWDQIMIDKCQKMLFDTGLLILEDGMVSSKRVKKNFERRDNVRELGKTNANKRWGANGGPMAPQCDPNAIKGKEKKGKESKETFTSTAPNGAAPISVSPKGPTPENLMKLWNSEAHANLPRVKDLTEKRKRHINARLTEFPEHSFWKDILGRINRSRFLTGEGGQWKATFDWVMNPTNLIKIKEGNYDNR